MIIDADQMAMTAQAPTRPIMNPTVAKTPVIVVRARKAPDFQVRTRCRCCEVSVMKCAPCKVRLSYKKYGLRTSIGSWMPRCQGPGRCNGRSLLEDSTADRAGDPHGALDGAVDEAAPAQRVVGAR